MKSLICVGVLLMAVTVIVMGCQKAADQPQAKQYDLHGKVVAVDPAGKTVTIDHEDIPGLMQGMEMEFKVENPDILEGVSAGDQVHGELEDRSGNYIIKKLTKQ